jgi:hypothetical protein
VLLRPGWVIAALLTKNPPSWLRIADWYPPSTRAVRLFETLVKVQPVRLYRIQQETVNKLASINPDFRDFLKRIKIDITSREIRREMYDRVLDKDELVESLAKKK